LEAQTIDAATRHKKCLRETLKEFLGLIVFAKPLRTGR
jgi:hypothetical protein